MTSDTILETSQFNVGESKCQNLNGHLVSFLDKNEMTFVYDLYEIFVTTGQIRVTTKYSSY